MTIQSSGAQSSELLQISGTHLRADQKIRCLRDHIVVKPLDIEHSYILQVIERGKPVRGVVQAVGPGHYPKRYDHPDKHRRSKMWDSKRFQPTEVKVGDIVELGSPQGQRGYSFQQFMWGDELHILCREADISGIVTEE